MVSRNHCRQREGEANIFSVTQTSGSWCCTLMHTHSSLGFLSLSTGKRAGGKDSQDTFPSLKASPLQHHKARTEAVLLRHKIFSSWTSKTLPSCPHWKAVEWHLSTDICLLAKHFSSLCQRSRSPKKTHFVVRKAGWDRSLWLLGFWLAGNTAFFFLFFSGANTVLTDDRKEDGALSIWSSWKSMRYFLRSHQYFTAVLYITH